MANKYNKGKNPYNEESGLFKSLNSLISQKYYLDDAYNWIVSNVVNKVTAIVSYKDNIFDKSFDHRAVVSVLNITKGLNPFSNMYRTASCNL